LKSNETHENGKRESPRSGRIYLNLGSCNKARMQLRIFVVPIKNLGGAEAGMNEFLRGNRVLAVKKEFVPDN